MGFKSAINRLTGREDTLEGQIDPREQVPIEVAELIERKRRVLKDKIPAPGTPEEAIANRFDKQIEEAWIKHGGEAQQI